MGISSIITTSVGINLFGSSMSYLSRKVFKKLLEDNLKLKKRSNMFGTIVSFVFSVVVTALILGSGLGEWKNNQIEKISTVVEKKIQSCLPSTEHNECDDEEEES